MKIHETIKGCAACKHSHTYTREEITSEAESELLDEILEYLENELK